jgi:hypothetical protein|tara:strand:+ start:28 stop:756 length:729 start_codon:yes stop_codon:yes gene_type:complete
MKKIILIALVASTVTVSPLAAFAGFGLSVNGTSLTVAPSTSPLTFENEQVGEFIHYGFENGGGIGGYLYLDFIPVVDIDVEFNLFGNLYDFSLQNGTDYSSDGIVEPEKLEFVYAAGNAYVTIQKPLYDLNIPFLAEAKLYAGLGFNTHTATPMIDQEMLEAVVTDTDGVTDLGDGEFDSAALEEYLVDNVATASGFHFQVGAQLHLLTFDIFAYYRYTMAKDMIPGNDGFSSLNLRFGLGI